MSVSAVTLQCFCHYIILKCSINYNIDKMLQLCYVVCVTVCIPACVWCISVQVIEKYLTNTHAATHALYKMKLLDVFEVQRDVEVKSFVDHGNR